MSGEGKRTLAGTGRRGAAWALLSLAAAIAWLPGPADAQLPPIPKAATPAKSGKPEPVLPPIPMEPPLLPAPPKDKDFPKSDKPCADLPDKGVEWLRDALATLQGQSLRPGGLPKARDAYAELWIFFLGARSKGYDVDAYAGKVEALYVGLYPSGAFAPSSPFEKFKEPRRSCKKPPAP